MAILLADVGGTNARLAIARSGGIDPETVTRFRGDDFSSFDDVVRQFLAEQGNLQIESACIAVAGPVGGGVARLTNRNWDFSEERLARLTNAGQLRLINDLTALGYAVPSLQGDSVSLLRDAPADRNRNGQALVVGLGTGYNVCAVRKLSNGRIMAMEAEEGHTQLPANIYMQFYDMFGRDVAGIFATAEETFAGRGLSMLHALMIGTEPVRSEMIAEAAAQGDPDANATYDFFAGLAGLLCRELALRFMPLEGLYLAGSVGRSIADRMDKFTQAFLAEEFMRHIPQNTPVLLIRDDMAALQGCLAALA